MKKETRETIVINDTYSIIKIDVEDEDESYFFPQFRYDGTRFNGEWLFILCNNYCNIKGIQHIYTTEELRIESCSSFQYVQIGCHSEDFARELIKCHRMGLDKYIIKKNVEREELESRIALDSLSLPELHSLYDLLDRGIADGNSTGKIQVEARGFQGGDENWKLKYANRKKSLKKIKKAIKEITSKIDY